MRNFLRSKFFWMPIVLFFWGVSAFALWGNHFWPISSLHSRPVANATGISGISIEEISRAGLLGGPNDVFNNPSAIWADKANEDISRRSRILDALPKADIVLDAPEKMKVGDKRQVDANIGINVPMEILKRKPRPGDRQIQSVARVSSQMAAALTGPGFEINLKTPEIQSVAEGYPTVWSWTIKATIPANRSLKRHYTPSCQRTPRVRGNA